MYNRYQKNIRLATSGITNSYTQIFFSNNPFVAFFIIAVSFFDIYAGISGLLSIIITNLAAWLIGLDKYKIAQGYYGFNSLLVGLGIGIYFNMSTATILIIIISALLSLLIAMLAELILGKYNMPYLSLPFVFTLWIVSIATREFSVLGISIRGVYNYNDMFALGGKQLIDIYEWGNNLPLLKSLRIYFLSLGAIVFQNNILAGMFLAVGILIYSRIAFILSFVGFYAAYFFYQALGTDINDLYYSYIGFNYILTAIALGGYYLVPNKYTFITVIMITPVVVLITIAISQLLKIHNLPVYSLPFNIVVLMFLNILKFRTRNFNLFQPIYIQHQSPEKNLYAIKNYQHRFKNEAQLPILLPFHGAWKVTQAHNGEITHKNNWQHAWDFEIVDETGKSYKNSGDYPDDYFCYNKWIIAPADGIIEEIFDGIPDNIIGTQNLKQNWGNTIIIKHYSGLYSKYSHIKSGTIKVTKGQQVKSGEVLAQVGNSGRSPVPHLHFQLQSAPYIGSDTLYYPISSYIVINNDITEYKNFSIPQKGQIVENVKANPTLKNAFQFISGQSLTFINQEGKSQTIQVKSTYYGKNYLYDAVTDSYAYFRTDGKTTYFEHYDGNKKTDLYFLYLAAYKVNMSILSGDNLTTDQLPVSCIAPNYLLKIQDFIAPFYIFMNTGFTAEIKNASDSFTNTNIELTSRVAVTICHKVIKYYNFTFLISDSGIENFIIETKSEKTILKCTKN